MKRILSAAVLATALGLAGGAGSHHAAHAATSGTTCLGRVGGTCGGGTTTPPPSSNPPPCLPLGHVIQNCVHGLYLHGH